MKKLFSAAVLGVFTTNLYANLIGSPIFDPVCNDGLSGNGIETVTPGIGCTRGGLPDLDDNNPYTIDFFDESTDEIVHLDMNTGQETRTPFGPSQFMVSGMTFPTDQAVNIGESLILSYAFPSNDFVLQIDFNFQDLGVVAPIGNFMGDIELTPSTNVIDNATLVTNGLGSIGRYQVYALLIDTTKSYLSMSGSTAYGGELGSFFIDVVDASVPSPGTVVLFGFGLVGIGYMRRKKLT